MKQYIVEVKTGPGRWDAWQQIRVFKTRTLAAAFCETLKSDWRIREEVVI